MRLAHLGGRRLPHDGLGRGDWRYEFAAVRDSPRLLDRLNPLIDALAPRYNTRWPYDALGQCSPSQCLGSPSAADASPSQIH